jgi:hypothetical protein
VDTVKQLFVDAEFPIRRLPTTKSETSIRRSPSAEFEVIEDKDDKWIFPASFLLSKLSYTHLKNIICL